jgi:transposase
MELSTVQQNTARSADLAQAMAAFLSKGGSIHTLEGPVFRPKPEPKPYGRQIAPPPKPKRAKTQVRSASSLRIEVNEALLQQIRDLAPVSSKMKVEQETGISRYLLNRLAKEHGFEFKKHDPNPNLKPPTIDPVADAVNVLRVKELRGQGLARKQAAAAMGVSHNLVARLIRDYDIDFPTWPAGKRR